MARNKLFGVVNLTENDVYMKQLTFNRPIASVPFLGRYRMIDFTLSNMVNAGITTVGIFLNDRYRSLMDHISSGKEWDLDRKQGGVFYFSPYATPDLHSQQRGDISTYFSNIDYLTEASADYAVIMGTTMVCNIDLKKVFKEHLESKADITVVYKTIMEDDFSFERCNTVTLNEYGGVVTFGKNLRRPDMQSGKKKISAEIYIVRKELLVDMITNAITTGENVFLTDVLHDSVARYKVRGYEFDGLLKNVSSVQSYYEASMFMLDEDHIKDVFFGENRIRTKVKDETPTYYSEDSDVQNSLIANGCKIEGTVINSIIFRRVTVEKGAVVKDSIIMQNGEIRANCKISHVITDKQVVLTEGTELQGSPKNPVVVGKGSVL
ncbi:glucose-1-phosphate adenylyltransferase subunit GlgD [Proteiniclasticum sp. BAD-10]|uniref:Glucose-1-phosphate adenylyltransferase subunit GlgD n=1 Tax=Proteiniclasticum sediminis TaxID=2804028 RepID=A0A941HNT4_9CLOT|nr:glucose-1-phosphate adenylyltransferase subunit GlgD [Proteiniclasticum sediminis]MBR0574796.1 glucose-1-phosphate adenylyltransferase subunit GlgD [Proteiniclasticum sediminis]